MTIIQNQLPPLPLTDIRNAMDLLQNFGVLEESTGDQYLNEWMKENNVTLNDLNEAE